QVTRPAVFSCSVSEASRSPRTAGVQDRAAYYRQPYDVPRGMLLIWSTLQRPSGSATPCVRHRVCDHQLQVPLEVGILGSPAPCRDECRATTKLSRKQLRIL